MSCAVSRRRSSSCAAVQDVRHQEGGSILHPLCQKMDGRDRLVLLLLLLLVVVVDSPITSLILYCCCCCSIIWKKKKKKKYICALYIYHPSTERRRRRNMEAFLVWVTGAKIRWLPTFLSLLLSTHYWYSSRPSRPFHLYTDVLSDCSN